jgi:formylglycine-generating enzyme required for sulfatase activity
VRVPGIPACVWEILQHGAEKEPRARYQSAAELIAALDAALTTGGDIPAGAGGAPAIVPHAERRADRSLLRRPGGHTPGLWRERAARVPGQTRVYLRRHPVAAVAVAAGLGLVLLVMVLLTTWPRATSEVAHPSQATTPTVAAPSPPPKVAASSGGQPIPPPQVTLAPSLAPTITNSIGMKLVLIPAGEFLMGSPATEEGRYSDEQQHRVRITKPYYLGATEVTQTQYEAVMRENLSDFKGPQRPVETVSWDDAASFCDRLSALQAEKVAGRTYRLPTEAEWEYASRAGSTARYAYGDDAAALGDHAWFVDNSSETTHPVGEKQPNAWGLYDMHGNVWEWCADWYGEYTNSLVDDPTGPATGSERVHRGGCWLDPATDCRTAYRGKVRPFIRVSDLGFRVATVPSGSK